MTYRVIDAFKGIFEGKLYRHRDSSLGDFVASFLIDDLYQLGRSSKLAHAVELHQSVLNIRNKPIGRNNQRRGDGTFGPRIPTVQPITVADHIVSLGEVASTEVGSEVKILAKAMQKQIDRVCTDLINQSREFESAGGHPIKVAIVGVNHAETYRSVEGEREFIADGKKYKRPLDEAAGAIDELQRRVTEHYDELLILKFSATNIEPFPFEWLDRELTERNYGAALLRVAREYELRF